MDDIEKINQKHFRGPSISVRVLRRVQLEFHRKGDAIQRHPLEDCGQRFSNRKCKSDPFFQAQRSLVFAPMQVVVSLAVWSTPPTSAFLTGLISLSAAEGEPVKRREQRKVNTPKGPHTTGWPFRFPRWSEREVPERETPRERKSLERAPPSRANCSSNKRPRRPAAFCKVCPSIRLQRERKRKLIPRGAMGGRR